jgi:hypothetical protein
MLHLPIGDMKTHRHCQRKQTRAHKRQPRRP